MPTTRPRYQVTETPAVAAALDRAGQRWPGEPRSRLLLRLIETGGKAIEQEHSDSTTRHRDAVQALGGAFPDAFPPGYLRALREDWPA